MKKILMIILDGFGIRKDTHGNAIAQANMEYFNKLWEEYPHSILEASGEAVGLPENQFGNSEVCHETIGLGHKIKQKETIILEEVNSKRIMDNEELNKMIEHCNANSGVLHLMGLLSDGGVHSHISYMLKLIPLLKEKGIKKIVFHAITDGRDTYRTCSLKYIHTMNKILTDNEIGYIADVCGRYYAMDRDDKWDRTKRYYDMVVNGIGLNIINIETAINTCYQKEITDEFLPPLIIKQEPIKEGDTLLWLNFRPDRARQIMNSLTDPGFNDFPVRKFNNLRVWMMYEQDSVKNARSLFVQEEASLYPLGEYFSDLNLTQARVAETEKYSHVTTFFNAEKSPKFKGTDNFLIHSPKVSTYDQTPLMSAVEVTKQVQKCLERDYDFILVNYANPDMLGHTGNMEATVQGLKAIDKLLKTVIETANDNFYKVIITADHGNCDEMLDDNDNILTTHSMYPVPFIILDKHVELREKGDITSIAPTLLKYMDIAIPKEMKESKVLIIDN